MTSVGVAARSGAWARPQLLSALLPLNTGPDEIYAVDGLRALAALGVMFFHSYYTVTRSVVAGGFDITFLWNYSQTGVHLFFVLSGFLLFTPFARAMLDSQPLPSVKRFFQRRALRIMPAYLVCLTILAALQWRSLASLTGLANIGMHLTMFYDDTYAFNRAIEGPFWTLAVEAQFYLILPIFAWSIARFAGATRSRWRVIAGVMAIIAGALLMRMVDATVHGRYATRAGLSGKLASLFVHATLGAQGKYLEVFALGMLCAVLYLALQDESRRWRRRLPWISVALVAGALAAMYWLAHVARQVDIVAPAYLLFYRAFAMPIIAGPLMVGVPYAAVLLGALWGPRWLRAIFETPPLRFIGAISYSLYLWHLPILQFAARAIALIPPDLRIGFELLAGFTIAIPVAYLSYQFVERPFLKRRRRIAVQPA